MADTHAEAWYLDRGILHQVLDRLRAVESRAELLQQTQALRQALADPSQPIHHVAATPAAVSVQAIFVLDALEQIEAAHTLERALYYVRRLQRGLLTVRTNTINDINLNRWKEYTHIITDSLWIEERRDRSGTHSADYWGNFIPQIPHQMMQRYTRSGDWVLDTFAGSGTTLIEARRLGRNALGVELQPAVAEQTSARVQSEPNHHAVHTSIHTGDSTTVDWAALLAQHGQQSAQLVLMHPPYFDIIRFSNDPRDLSNAASVEHFLQGLSQVAANVVPLLERGRFLVLVIGDTYTRGEWLPLGFWAMQAVQQHGLRLKSIVVKNFEDTAGKRSQKELWRYRALVGGFYVFKHEYIFIFQKL